jgi:hypothetical protein
MARLPIVKRDQVPEQFRQAFDEVTAESGGVIASGPGSITINSPEMARRRNHLTSYLRYETTFSKRIRNWPSLPPLGRWTALMSGTHMRPLPAGPG